MAIELPVPLEKLFGALTGMSWPQANEDLLRKVSGDYASFASSIDQLTDYIVEVINVVVADFSGLSADSFLAAMRNLIGLGGGDDYLSEAQSTAQQLSKIARETADDVEYAKLMIIAQLVLLMAQIAIAMVWAPFTFGGVLALLKLVMEGVREAIFEILLWLVKSIAMHTVVGIAGGTVLSLVIQGVIGDGINGAEVKQAVEFGAVNGVLAGPMELFGSALGDAFGKLVGEDASKVVAKELDKPLAEVRPVDAGAEFAGEGAEAGAGSGVEGEVAEAGAEKVGGDGLADADGDAEALVGSASKSVTESGGAEFEVGKPGADSGGSAGGSGESAAGSVPGEKVATASGGATAKLAAASGDAMGKATGSGKVALGSGERGLVEVGVARAFTKDLGELLHKVAVPLEQGFAGRPETTAFFVRQMGAAFGRGFKDVLGVDAGRDLGARFAQGFVRSWAHGGIEDVQELSRSLAKSLAAAGVSEQAVEALAWRLPELAQGLEHEGNVWFHLGKSFVDVMRGGLENVLTQVFYDLIFEHGQVDDVSWTAFVGGMAMGVIGAVAHKLVEPLARPYMAKVREWQAENFGPDDGRYFPVWHPLTALSVLSNLAGFPAPLLVARVPSRLTGVEDFTVRPLSSDWQQFVADDRIRAALGLERVPSERWSTGWYAALVRAATPLENPYIPRGDGSTGPTTAGGNGFDGGTEVVEKSAFAEKPGDLGKTGGIENDSFPDLFTRGEVPPPHAPRNTRPPDYEAGALSRPPGLATPPRPEDRSGPIPEASGNASAVWRDLGEADRLRIVSRVRNGLSGGSAYDGGDEALHERVAAEFDVLPEHWRGQPLVRRADAVTAMIAHGSLDVVHGGFGKSQAVDTADSTARDSFAAQVTADYTAFRQRAEAPGGEVGAVESSVHADAEEVNAYVRELHARLMASLRDAIGPAADHAATTEALVSEFQRGWRENGPVLSQPAREFLHQTADATTALFADHVAQFADRMSSQLGARVEFRLANMRAAHASLEYALHGGAPRAGGDDSAAAAADADALLRDVSQFDDVRSRIGLPVAPMHSEGLDRRIRLGAARAVLPSPVGVEGSTRDETIREALDALRDLQGRMGRSGDAALYHARNHPGGESEQLARAWLGAHEAARRLSDVFEHALDPGFRRQSEDMRVRTTWSVSHNETRHAHVRELNELVQKAFGRDPHPAAAEIPRTLRVVRRLTRAQIDEGPPASRAQRRQDIADLELALIRESLRLAVPGAEEALAADSHPAAPAPRRRESTAVPPLVPPPLPESPARPAPPAQESAAPSRPEGEGGDPWSDGALLRRHFRELSDADTLGGEVFGNEETRQWLSDYGISAKAMLERVQPEQHEALAALTGPAARLFNLHMHLPADDSTREEQLKKEIENVLGSVRASRQRPSVLRGIRVPVTDDDLATVEERLDLHVEAVKPAIDFLGVHARLPAPAGPSVLVRRSRSSSESESLVDVSAFSTIPGRTTVLSIGEDGGFEVRSWYGADDERRRRSEFFWAPGDQSPALARMRADELNAKLTALAGRPAPAGSSGREFSQDLEDLWWLARDIGATRARGTGSRIADVFTPSALRRQAGRHTWDIARLAADLHGGIDELDVPRLTEARRTADVVRDALAMPWDARVTVGHVERFIEWLNRESPYAPEGREAHQALLETVTAVKQSGGVSRFGHRVRPAEVMVAWRRRSARPPADPPAEPADRGAPAPAPAGVPTPAGTRSIRWAEPLARADHRATGDLDGPALAAADNERTALAVGKRAELEALADAVRLVDDGRITELAFIWRNALKEALRDPFGTGREFLDTVNGLRAVAQRYVEDASDLNMTAAAREADYVSAGRSPGHAADGPGSGVDPQAAAAAGALAAFRGRFGQARYAEPRGGGLRELLEGLHLTAVHDAGVADFGADLYGGPRAADSLGDAIEALLDEVRELVNPVATAYGVVRAAAEAGPHVEFAARAGRRAAVDARARSLETARQPPPPPAGEDRDPKARGAQDGPAAERVPPPGFGEYGDAGHVDEDGAPLRNYPMGRRSRVASIGGTAVADTGNIVELLARSLPAGTDAATVAAVRAHLRDFIRTRGAHALTLALFDGFRIRLGRGAGATDVTLRLDLDDPRSAEYLPFPSAEELPLGLRDHGAVEAEKENTGADSAAVSNGGYASLTATVSTAFGVPHAGIGGGSVSLTVKGTSGSSDGLGQARVSATKYVLDAGGDRAYFSYPDARISARVRAAGSRDPLVNTVPHEVRVHFPEELAPERAAADAFVRTGRFDVGLPRTHSNQDGGDVGRRGAGIAVDEEPTPQQRKALDGIADALSGVMLVPQSFAGLAPLRNGLKEAVTRANGGEQDPAIEESVDFVLDPDSVLNNFKHIITGAGVFPPYSSERTGDGYLLLDGRLHSLEAISQDALPLKQEDQEFSAMSATAGKSGGFELSGSAKAGSTEVEKLSPSVSGQVSAATGIGANHTLGVDDGAGDIRGIILKGDSVLYEARMRLAGTVVSDKPELNGTTVVRDVTAYFRITEHERARFEAMLRIALGTRSADEPLPVDADPKVEPSARPERVAPPAMASGRGVGFAAAERLEGARHVLPTAVGRILRMSARLPWTKGWTEKDKAGLRYSLMKVLSQEALKNRFVRLFNRDGVTARYVRSAREGEEIIEVTVRAVHGATSADAPPGTAVIPFRSTGVVKGATEIMNHMMFANVTNADGRSRYHNAQATLAAGVVPNTSLSGTAVLSYERNASATLATGEGGFFLGAILGAENPEFKDLLRYFDYPIHFVVDVKITHKPTADDAGWLDAVARKTYSTLVGGGDRTLRIFAGREETEEIPNGTVRFSVPEQLTPVAPRNAQELAAYEAQVAEVGRSQTYYIAPRPARPRVPVNGAGTRQPALKAPAHPQKFTDGSFTVDVDQHVTELIDSGDVGTALEHVLRSLGVDERTYGPTARDLASKGRLVAAMIRSSPITGQFRTKGLWRDHVVDVVITAHPKNRTEQGEPFDGRKMNVAEGKTVLTASTSKGEKIQFSGRLGDTSTAGTLDGGTQQALPGLSTTRDIRTKSSAQSESFIPTTGALTQTTERYTHYGADTVFGVTAISRSVNRFGSTDPKAAYAIVETRGGMTYLGLPRPIGDDSRLEGTRAITTDLKKRIVVERGGVGDEDPATSVVQALPSMPGTDPDSRREVPAVPLVPMLAATERLVVKPDQGAGTTAPAVLFDPAGETNPLVVTLKKLITRVAPQFLESDFHVVGSESFPRVSGKLTGVLNEISAITLIDVLLGPGLEIQASHSFPGGNSRLQLILRATRDPDGTGYRFTEAVPDGSIARYSFRLTQKATSAVDTKAASNGVSFGEQNTPEYSRKYNQGGFGLSAGADREHSAMNGGQSTDAVRDTLFVKNTVRYTGDVELSFEAKVTGHPSLATDALTLGLAKAGSDATKAALGWHVASGRETLRLEERVLVPKAMLGLKHPLVPDGTPAVRPLDPSELARLDSDKFEDGPHTTTPPPFPELPGGAVRDQPLRLDPQWIRDHSAIVVGGADHRKLRIVHDDLVSRLKKWFGQGTSAVARDLTADGTVGQQYLRNALSYEVITRYMDRLLERAGLRLKANGRGGLYRDATGEFMLDAVLRNPHAVGTLLGTDEAVDYLMRQHQNSRDVAHNLSFGVSTTHNGYDGNQHDLSDKTATDHRKDTGAVSVGVGGKAVRSLYDELKSMIAANATNREVPWVVVGADLDLRVQFGGRYARGLLSGFLDRFTQGYRVTNGTMVLVTPERALELGTIPAEGLRTSSGAFVPDLATTNLATRLEQLHAAHSLPHYDGVYVVHVSLDAEGGFIFGDRSLDVDQFARQVLGNLGADVEQVVLVAGGPASGGGQRNLAIAADLAARLALPVIASDTAAFTRADGRVTAGNAPSGGSAPGRWWNVHPPGDGTAQGLESFGPDLQDVIEGALAARPEPNARHVPPLKGPVAWGEAVPPPGGDDPSGGTGPVVPGHVDGVPAGGGRPSVPAAAAESDPDADPDAPWDPYADWDAYGHRQADPLPDPASGPGPASVAAPSSLAEVIEAALTGSDTRRGPHGRGEPRSGAAP